METRIWKFFATTGPMIALIACARPASTEQPVQDLSESAAFDFTLSRLVGEDDRIGYDPSHGSIGPFVARRIALDENDSVTVAYLVGSDWCGSGGCTLAVVHGEGREARLAGWTTVSRPPIRILPTRSHGMPDLAVRVCGGGIAECYDAVLTFDGESYPHNPSLHPAVRTSTPAEGRTVISDADVSQAIAGRSG